MSNPATSGPAQNPQFDKDIGLKKEFREGMDAIREKVHANTAIASGDPAEEQQRRNLIEKLIQAIMSAIAAVFSGIFDYSKSMWQSDNHKKAVPEDEEITEDGTGHGPEKDAPELKGDKPEAPGKKPGGQNAPTGPAGPANSDGSGEAGQDNTTADSNIQSEREAEDVGHDGTDYGDYDREQDEGVPIYGGHKFSFNDPNGSAFATQKASATDAPLVREQKHPNSMGVSAPAAAQFVGRIYKGENGRPTRFMPAEARQLEYDTKHKILEALRRAQSDDELMARIANQVKQGNQTGAVKALMLPIYRDLSDQAKAAETKLINDLSDLLEKSGLNTEEVDVLAKTLVKAMPHNIAPQMLRDEIAQEVEDLFKTRLGVVGDYMQYRAATGAMRQSSFAGFEDLSDLVKQVESVGDRQTPLLSLPDVFYRNEPQENNEAMKVVRERQRA